MFIVRGNNIFPTAIEAVVRRFEQVAEFRVTVLDRGRGGRSLAEVKVEVEPTAESTPGAAGGMDQNTDLAGRVGRALQEALSLRAEVTTVPPGTLPRFEMKARRFVRA